MNAFGVKTRRLRIRFQIANCRFSNCRFSNCRLQIEDCGSKLQIQIQIADSDSKKSQTIQIACELPKVRWATESRFGGLLNQDSVSY